ncbi:ATP synthase subunit C lysine N-methyltransferase isoform X2 [Venturia canescens]|uniref:ATP synthase subunit C lysine N-methyltransferase isoform X2 n=1 Tax=Venturia canescens TaxID=32260 RepID=UPI001C9D5BE9|nr:ATP synthase subunit C lysine N-methyltransferase isoform X2 [Venturia canescens]
MNELGWTSNDIVKEIPNGSSKFGLFLIGVTGGVGAALSIVCIPFVSPALRRICLPYVPATTQQIENVLVALQGRTGSLVDLGSGDGRLVLAAARKGFLATGVELNAWLVLYSKISSSVQGLSSLTLFHRKDLWKFDLSRYDNVIIFGVEQMMEELERKFIKELKEDCRIVACRFPLPHLKPVKTVGHGVDTVWIYAMSSKDSRSS